MRTLIVLFALIASSSAFANLIANGSFESPVVPPDSNVHVPPPPDDWTGGAFQMNGNGGGFPIAPEDGNQFEDIGNGPSYALSQSFTVAVGDEGTYQLSWYDNNLTNINGGTDSYTTSVLDSSSAVIATQTNGYEHGAPWMERTLSVNLNTAGSYTLVFTRNPGDTLDALIDNVQLTPGAVPLPTAACSGTILLAGLGFAKFRRRVN